MKATSVVAPAKAAKAIPDLEEAIEEEDEGEVLAEPADEEDDDLDLSKDKYIKKPKAKKAAATKKTAGKKGRTFKDDDNPDECASDEETKPKKSRAGKGKTTATRGKDKK
jgi:replication factor C subunit 1